jgi:hypothetical protein
MVMNRRTRLITFRVSEKEYETLKLLQALHGARSISDMARESMLHATLEKQETVALDKLHSYVSYLEQRVVDLDRAVRDLAMGRSGENSN